MHFTIFICLVFPLLTSCQTWPPRLMQCHLVSKSLAPQMSLLLNGVISCVCTCSEGCHTVFFYVLKSNLLSVCWDIRGWRRLVKTEWVPLVFIVKHSVWNTLSFFAPNVGKRQVVKTSDSHNLSQNLPADALLNLTVSTGSHPKGWNNT